MAELKLTGVSDDGQHLLLTDPDGAEHSLPITSRLRSALRESPSPSGRLEKPMDSVLRPRDIQARIRSGESPETVAEAAGTQVDKIMAFAGPVLAEREHVAQRAQTSSLRRTSGEARTLGDAVSAHLGRIGARPDSVEWDSWRRGDGRWSLVAVFTAAEREGIAEFSFDMPGNYVTVDNDEARWLVGEGVETGPTLTTADDDLERARRRRLSAVSDEPPLGDDAISLVTDAPEPEAVPEPLPEEPAYAEQLTLDDVENDDDTAVRPAIRDEPVDQPVEEAVEEPARRPVQKKRGRASVPSWDEIMFGGGDQ